LTPAVRSVAAFGAEVRRRKVWRTAIRNALEASRATWNKGNLEDCMSVYWDSPQLTLWSGGDTIRGYADVLDHYKHQTLGGEMGQLVYDDVVVDFLSTDAALVRAGWRWKSGLQEQHGFFTALMRKFPDGWKTVHEHSSRGTSVL
jgi:ketosteroid isomerase-like protein